MNKLFFGFFLFGSVALFASDIPCKYELKMGKQNNTIEEELIRNRLLLINCSEVSPSSSLRVFKDYKLKLDLSSKNFKYKSRFLLADKLLSYQKIQSLLLNGTEHTLATVTLKPDGTIIDGELLTPKQQAEKVIALVKSSFSLNSIYKYSDLFTDDARDIKSLKISTILVFSNDFTLEANEKSIQAGSCFLSFHLPKSTIVTARAKSVMEILSLELDYKRYYNSEKKPCSWVNGQAVEYCNQVSVNRSLTNDSINMATKQGLYKGRALSQGGRIIDINCENINSIGDLAFEFSSIGHLRERFRIKPLTVEL